MAICGWVTGVGERLIGALRRIRRQDFRGSNSALAGTYCATVATVPSASFEKAPVICRYRLVMVLPEPMS